ncbi:MAG: putative carbohydrate kinase [Methanobacterium sp. PtaB.Bin024]|jgi:NAD(P)H-hydrate epimerase|nr:MAG: putative carbohydrate kinase [Methanobacterium sp. PtaB.Bin024]
MTPKDMMVADANAEAMGIPRTSLMENAGRCLAQRIIQNRDPCKVAIYAGNGGNGGDGFVAARYLLNEGFEVEVFLLSDPSSIKSKETKLNWEVLEKISKGITPLKLEVVRDSSYLSETDAEILIDALLGTGVRGELREPVSTAVDIINRSEGFKVAVDVPTGVDPGSGMVTDKAVQADVTITFHKVKVGLNIASVEYVGSIEACDIGIPIEAELFTGPGDLLRLQNRDYKSHKGQNGKVLVIGGSKDYSGAPALAALSSLAAGADIVVVACPHELSSIIRSYSPDLIVHPLSEDFLNPKDTDELIKLSENFDAVVLGCGIGREEETSLAVNDLVVEIEKPIVIDADALKLISPWVLPRRNYETVITPHAGEFKEFSGRDAPKDLESRMEVIKDVSTESETTVLLKGPTDIIARNDNLKLNNTGNPGMTVGGTGDCLAGLTGALLAQGHDGFEAAVLGAYINGKAGDMAAYEYGYNFRATNLMKFVPEIFFEK